MTLGRSATRTGFTLIELLVAMTVLALVMAGAFALFNLTNTLARTQLHVADMQQSARIGQQEMIRMVQMAGRGGLAGGSAAAPASQVPAITVRNNAGLEGVPREIAVGSPDPDVPLAVEGTDVLTVRGVFDSPPYQVNYRNAGTFSLAGTAGSVTLSKFTTTGIEQDLSPLAEAIQEGLPEALILVSSTSDIYGVAELDPGGSTVDDFDDPTLITAAFRTAGGSHADAYALLSTNSVFPVLRGVSLLGIVEEYRFYVREAFAVDGDPESEPIPKLALARLFPGTEATHPSGNLSTDLADNVWDLQVALGFDSAYDGSGLGGGFFDQDADNEGPDDLIVDGESASDDWLLNAEADDPLTSPWVGPWDAAPYPPNANPQPRLYYARISTLTRTARADRSYAAPVIQAIEDHAYPLDASDPINSEEGRKYRRQLLQTVVDLRNVS